MQVETSSQSDNPTPAEILADLIVRQLDFWQGKPSKFSKDRTNLAALHSAIDLNRFLMREIEKIVVLGLGDPGTVEQLRDNYTGEREFIQVLTANQRETQNVAITQLGLAQIIRDYIKTIWRSQQDVTLYVCDQFLRESNKSVLEELDFTIIGRHSLSRHIDQNTLVYTVNMDDRDLQMAIDFSGHPTAVTPVAVITQIMNGELDV